MHAKKLEEKKNEGMHHIHVFLCFCVFFSKVTSTALSRFCVSLSDLMSRLLANGKGAVFLVTPHAGTLGPLETLTVNVTAYMEMWGKYTDNLLCKV